LIAADILISEYIGNCKGMLSMAKVRKAKRGRPKTTGTGALVAVRCHPEFLAALDRWRAAQPRQPGQAAGMTRPQAIRALAEIALIVADKDARQ
jgi:hypothetical protein